jgi:hypothetical protein
MWNLLSAGREANQFGAIATGGAAYGNSSRDGEEAERSETNIVEASPISSKDFCQQATGEGRGAHF